MRIVTAFPKNKRMLDSTEEEQEKKAIEEFWEWRNDFGDPVHKVEEAIDLIVAVDGWLQKQEPAVFLKGLARFIKKCMKRGDW